MSGNPLLDTWYEDSRRRRHTGEPTTPLAPRLLGPMTPSLRSADPLARAVIALVAGPSVTLGSDSNGSRAHLDSRHINLDASVLEGSGTLLHRLEKWIALASHEAAHLLWTPTDTVVRDPLFRAIQNLLEDERIEARIVEKRPEFAYSLEAARRDLLQSPEKDALFLEAVFALIRCEEPIPMKLWRRYEYRLRNVVEALSPFPDSYDGIRSASLEIALQIPPDQRDQIPIPIDPSWLSIGVGGRDGGLDHGGFASARLRRKIERGRGRCDEFPVVEFSTAPDVPDAYRQIRDKIARRASRLADRLMLFKPPRRGPRRSSGRIDRRHLHDVAFSPRIFRGLGPKPPSLCVAIIIDLSGSMSGHSERIAQEVSILIVEAVRQIPDARVEIFGHHADLKGRTNTQIRRFPINGENRALGLGRLPIGGNNRDAHAIDVIQAELATCPHRVGANRIALLIADGAPSANGFGGPPAIERTRESILALERAWGPVLYIATDHEERLRDMVPGPSLRFRSGDVVEDLIRHLTIMLRRSPGGRR